MNNKIIYEGFLKLGSNGEEDEILFLEGHSDPIAEELSDRISNKFITVRYYICNKETTLEQAEEYFVRQLYGEFIANYDMCYSEITGYLWTNEDLQVGGHDLLEELKSYVEKYLIMIIEIDEEKEKEKEIKRKWDNARMSLRNVDYWAKELGLTRDELIKQLDSKF